MIEIQVKIKSLNSYKIKITTPEEIETDCFYVQHPYGKRVIYYGDYYILFKRKNKHFMIEESIWKEMKYADKIQSL